MGYTRDLISGFSWQTALKFTLVGVAAVKLFFLARILQPVDFGLFSLVTIAFGIVEATTETGVNITILKSKQSVAYFIDTAWVIAILRGFTIGLIMMVLSIALSNFFQEPQLFFLIMLASLVPAIKGFINPAIVSLHKDLHFQQDTLYRLSLVVVDAIAAIGLTMFYPTVTSLVLSLIVTALFEVGISFFFFSLRPSFVYSATRARIIMNNAKWLSASAAFNYLNENIDNFLIGRLTSTYDLGLYHTSYSISHRLNYDFAKSLAHSTLPIFSKIKEERRRLRVAFKKSLGTLLALITLTTLPLFIMPQIAVWLLGAQWQNILSLLPVLLIAGYLQSIVASLYSLFYATSRFEILNFHQACTFGVLVILLLILTPLFGLTGGVWAVVLSRLIPLPILWLGYRQTFA